MTLSLRIDLTYSGLFSQVTEKKLIIHQMMQNHKEQLTWKKDCRLKMFGVASVTWVQATMYSNLGIRDLEF